MAHSTSHLTIFKVDLPSLPIPNSNFSLLVFIPDTLIFQCTSVCCHVLIIIFQNTISFTITSGESFVRTSKFEKWAIIFFDVHFG